MHTCMLVCMSPGERQQINTDWTYIDMYACRGGVLLQCFSYQMCGDEVCTGSLFPVGPCGSC